MANLLGLNRINIQIPNAGTINVVAGATVTIYGTMSDGSAAVTKDGIVSVGAVKPTIYADRNKNTVKSNPIISDSQGLVEFYVDATEVHIQVVTPSGISYGIPWFPIAAPDTSDVVEIKAFGAKGDGVTDDAAAIMAAHNALPATGGEIKLGRGQFLHKSQLLFTKRVVLRGESSLEDHTATPASCFLKHSSVNGTGVVFTGAASLVENMVFKGMGGNTGDGIQLKANGIQVKSCAVMGMGGVGVRVGDDGDGNFNSWVLIGVTSRGNGGDGFYIHSDTALIGGLFDANAGTCIGCNANLNGGHGFHLGNTAYGVYVGGLSESNTGWGWYLEQRAQNNLFLGGDTEGNTAGGHTITNVLCVDNIFIHAVNNQTFVDIPNARTIRYDKVVGNMPHGLGEIFTNGGITGHNPGLSGSNQQYMSLWDAAAERIRMGWTNNPPTTGLVPAQILADANTLYIASRDTAAAKIKLMAQTALAFYILLDPQNSKVEITESLIMTGAHGGMIQFPKMTAPSNGPANTGRLFLRDNGSGKMQLCVIFPSGAFQQIALEL